MLKDITPRDWGAFFISLIMLGFFGVYEVAVLYFKIPKDDGLSSILSNLTVLVAGYWIGSSKSSQNKDATNAAQAAALAQLSNPPRHPENNP